MPILSNMSHPALATLWSPCRAFRHKAVYLPPFRSIQCCNSVLRRLPVARCCHVASVEPVQDVLPQSRLPRERCLVALIQPLLKRLWLFLGCAVAALVALLASPPTSHAQDDGAFQAGVAAMTPEEAAEAGRNPRHRPKGVWVALNDPIGTMSNDLREAPKSAEEAINKHGIVTAWRTERLHDISYTQFLILLREGHIEKVKYKDNMKAIVVTTKPTCPGRGQQTQEVGLIYDPDLYNNLCAHGVAIEFGSSGKMAGIQAGILRMFGPVLVTFMVIAWSLTLGRQPDTDDPIFGGARMEMIRTGEVQTTFDDVAGIDDIKEQVMEVVSFLQDEETYLELGARAPAGVLLCGPPGVGKTLLAKAIAGQAGVPFYNSTGADLQGMFVGVGAARVRDMFERARKNAPCVLFIDEFDGVGQARSAASSASEENVQTINQLLTELDGFEDNTGVVVLAATNRPSALDEALTRPGRFDRIITIPYPNLQGRLAILAVHTRNKPLDEDVNMHRVARATAGFSGADLMNLMNQSAVESVRRQSEVVTEEDMFIALEKIQLEKVGGGDMQDLSTFDEGTVTPLIRRSIATYMAAKALVGLATPDYDDLQRIVVTPDNAPTGYVYFIPQDAHLETEIVTRSFMEAHMVVAMAGRVAEVAVMGAANMTTAGAGDIEQASDLARDMVFKCGWSLNLGPVNLGDDDDVDMLGGETETRLADISPMMASAGLADMAEMLRCAEAKAYFALVMNWELLNAMVDKIMSNEPHCLSRLEIEALVDQYGVVAFEDTFLEGFSFDEDNKLLWPPTYDYLIEDAGDIATGRRNAVPIVSKAMHSARPDVHPLNPYQPDSMYIPMDQELMEPSSAYFKPEAWYPLLEQQVKDEERQKEEAQAKQAAAAASN